MASVEAHAMAALLDAPLSLISALEKEERIKDIEKEEEAAEEEKEEGAVVVEEERPKKRRAVAAAPTGEEEQARALRAIMQCTMDTFPPNTDFARQLNTARVRATNDLMRAFFKFALHHCQEEASRGMCFVRIALRVFPAPGTPQVFLPDCEVPIPYFSHDKPPHCAYVICQIKATGMVAFFWTRYNLVLTMRTSKLKDGQHQATIAEFKWDRASIEAEEKRRNPSLLHRE